MKKLSLLLVPSLLFVLTSCDKQFDTVPQSASELKSAQLEQELINEQLNNELKNGQMVLNFRAHLSGGNEVPPNPSQATGEAIFQLSKDGTELSYKLIVANIDNVRMSHIHLAQPGVNGGIVTWLYPSAPPMLLIPGTTNGILAEGVITNANLIGALAGKTVLDLINHFKAGNAYVNVHTAQYGPGEICGQIMGNVK
jgi:hypothetical protein